jgi:ribosomal protein L11 methyltransferase
MFRFAFRFFGVSHLSFFRGFFRLPFWFRLVRIRFSIMSEEIMTNKNWICVNVSCGTDAVDHVASEIAEAFGVGVEMLEEGIRFYLDGGNAPQDWEQRLRKLLDGLKSSWYPDAPMDFTSSALPDDDWADRWKAHFKPLRVGERIIVCPTWEEVNPGPREKVIHLDPGRAFGTGHHETTRLCLEWIEAWAKARGDAAPGSLLDVGTGSGLLAMGAALLGFQPVLGVDNDPEAVEVARENVILNRLLDRVEILSGTAREVQGRFDVVVANIQAKPLTEMAEVLAVRLNRSGRLALGGILLEQKDSVQASYEARGLRLEELKTAGEWCLLVFESAND